MTIDMQMKMSIAGRQPPQTTLPAQKMTLEVVVDDVKPNGDIAYSFTYTDIEVVEDPRLTGILPPDAAPQEPIIE